MGLFSTKSSSSSSNVTSQTTTSTTGAQEVTQYDFSNFFGSSVAGGTQYQSAQSNAYTPNVYQEPSQSSTTTQRNDSSATSSLGLGSNPLGALGGITDSVANGGLSNLLGAGLDAWSSYNNSKNAQDYYQSQTYNSGGIDTSYTPQSSGGGFMLPLLIAGAGVALLAFW